MNKKLRMIKNSLDSIEVASDYGDKEEVNKYIEISRWLIDQDDNDDLFLEADRMFEELGYEKHEDEQEIIYDIEEDGAIHFSKSSKDYSVYDCWGYSETISLQMHIAIDRKLKELGWIDNK